MRNALAIARKELSIAFTTPAAWLVFTAMAFVTSFFFLAMLATFKQVQDMARMYTWARMPPDYAPYKNLTDGVIVQLWGVVLIVMVFVAPVLSMRLFSEERRQKTFELLMTAPVRPFEIVLGKYLGGLGLVTATIGITIVYPLILVAFGASESGSAVEWSTVLLGYASLLLWGATCIAVGMFMSSLTESQALAGLLTFAVLLVWMLIRGVAQGAEEPWRSVLGYVSFDTQLSNMMKGVLDVKALVFFASIIVLSLVATHRAVESQRWT